MDDFKNVPKPNLKRNFAQLKKRIKKDQSRADEDYAGYRHDMTNHTLAKDVDSEWHGLAAETLLRDDVKNGMHKNKKPKEFHQERDEYQDFDCKVFRGHIYQETRRNKDSAYWLVKKKKKEKKRLAKQQGKKYKDEGNDFYDPVIDFVSLEDWTYD